MLLLAAGGLLLMHGLDVGGHARVGDHAERELVTPASHEAAGTSNALPAAGHETESPGAAGHGGLVHVMSLCVAVVAVAARWALRRWSSASTTSPVAMARSVGARARRAVDPLLPPGPGRLALCILRI
jgi:hypothetical protein